MAYDPKKHHRRSIRLQGYDYSRPGAYFVTICTQNRACLFGQVVEGEMVLNDAGYMVQRWWGELNSKFPHVCTDAFVVMPNHVHGIVMIRPVGTDLRVRPDTDAERGAHASAPRSTANRPMVQNDDDERIYPPCEKWELAAISKTGMATQLLRTHHPGRTIPASHPPIHCRQPHALASGPAKSAAKMNHGAAVLAPLK